MNEGQTPKTNKIERFATNAVLAQYKKTYKPTGYGEAYGGYGRVPKTTVAYRRNPRLYKCKYQRLWELT